MCRVHGFSQGDVSGGIVAAVQAKGMFESFNRVEIGANRSVHQYRCVKNTESSPLYGARVRGGAREFPAGEAQVEATVAMRTFYRSMVAAPAEHADRIDQTLQARADCARDATTQRWLVQMRISPSSTAWPDNGTKSASMAA